MILFSIFTRMSEIKNIPNSKVTVVSAALKETFGTTDIAEPVLMGGGLSGSSVYKLEVAGKPYVLKIEQPNPAASGSSSLKLASDAGVAPKLYYQDAAAGITISDFIDAKPARAAYEPDELAAALAEKIRAVHAIPYGDGAGAPNLWDFVDGLIATFRQMAILNDPVFEEGFSAYARVKAAWHNDPADRVFSHNDLNPANILSDAGRLWLVDWRSAFVNNRYVDLAAAANFFIIPGEQDLIYLRTYFGQEPTNLQKAQYYLMRQVCRIIYSMLMFQVAARQKPADYKHDQQMEGVDLQYFASKMADRSIDLVSYEGQLIYGKAQMNEVIRQIRQPAFEEALKQL